MKNNRIVIINLNPAYDIHYNVDSFQPYGESYGKMVCRNIGGKGVNVALALTEFEVENECMIAVGRNNASDFMSKMAGINCYIHKCEGSIRENITIHKKGFDDTRISIDSFSIDESDLEWIKRGVSVKENDVLAFCGRLPKGITPECIVELLSKFQRQGVKIVVDSNSFSLDDIAKLKPWLIKPNKQELEALVGKSMESLDDCVTTAKTIIQKGIENVLVSLGKEGAFLVRENNECIFCQAPDIEAVSTVGAGDSAIAGFLYAYFNEMSIESCLMYSCAFGSASCLEEGTHPPSRKNVERLFAQIKEKNKYGCKSV